MAFPAFFAAIVMTAAVISPVAMANEEKLIYRNVHVTTPVSIVGSEAGVRLEYNLWGEGSVAGEFIYAPASQEYSKAEMTEKNLSLTTQGYEGAITVARFSQPFQMTGFFWSLTAGYRQLKAEWRHTPENLYDLKQRRLVDDEGQLTHKMRVSGTTGRGRLGYRYPFAAWPLVIGGYFGFRHYENKFTDEDSEGNPKTSEEERLQLKRLVMTRPEAGIELGFSF